MQEAVGVAIPHQLQFRREVLIALPELEQHREKGRDGNAAGKIRPRKAGLLHAPQLEAGCFQFLQTTVKEGGGFFAEDTGIGHAGDHEAANGTPLAGKLRCAGTLMVAQQVINRHDRTEIPALCPDFLRQFLDPPIPPADPAGSIQIGQIDT